MIHGGRECPAQKEKANTPQEANNVLHAWACALHALGTPLPAWREKQKTLLPPSLNEYGQYRRVHNGASEGTPTRDLEIANNKAVEAEDGTCRGQALTDLVLNSGETNSVADELYLGMIENLRAHRAEEMN
jgi:hypothetical protein